jgi:predicted HTH transcriptional regulator
MDLQTFLELNSRGESQTYERKLDAQWQQGLKGICAMLNTSGRGTLACGVRHDGAVVGVTGDLDAVMRGRSQTIRAKFDPAITTHQWHVIAHPDGNVLVLQAERSPSAGVHSYDGRLFVREGASNRQLTVTEALALERSRAAGPLIGPHICPTCGYRSALGMQIGGTITIGRRGIESWLGHDLCPRCQTKLVRA